jgi:perosamine synthetase
MTPTRYAPQPDRVRMPVWGRTTLLSAIPPLARTRPSDVARAEQNLERAFDGHTRATLVDSGTSAIRLALAGLGVGSQDEVIMAAFNCPQIANAILAAGSRPVLVDCGPRGGGPSLDAVSRALTPKTACIIITHQFGVVSGDAGDVVAFACKNGIPVIDDAAQAFGAKAGGIHAGLLGDVGVLSFGCTKPICCFGGGALLASNEHAVHREALSSVPAGRARRRAITTGAETTLAQMPPIIQERVRRITGERMLYLDVVAALNARDSNVVQPERIASTTARLLIRRLERLERDQAQWRRRAAKLAQLLAGLPIHLPEVAHTDRVGANFVVRTRLNDRFDLARSLSSAGIQTSWFHYPLARLSRYERFARSTASFYYTERLWPRVLVLPCGELHDRQLRYLAKIIQKHYQMTR